MVSTKITLGVTVF